MGTNGNGGIFTPEQDAVPAQLLPVCPYCAQDPANVLCRGPFGAEPMQFVIFYCGNPDCRKIWNCVKVEPPKPLLSTARIDPRFLNS